MTLEEIKREIDSHVVKPNDKKNYMFVSYKRDDREMVYPFVRSLQDAGVNLWMDTAMKASVGKSWQTPAFEAINNYNCKGILLFVSKSSLISIPILAELKYSLLPDVQENHDEDTFKIYPIDIDGIIDSAKSVSQYHNERKKELNEKGEIDRKELDSAFGKVLFPSENEKNNYLKGIKSYINLEKKIMEASGIDDDKKILAQNVNEVVESVRDLGVISDIEPPEKHEYNVVIINNEKTDVLQIKEGECVPKQDPGVKEGFNFGGWFVSGTNEEWDFSTPIHEDIEIYVKWDKGSGQKDEHVYTIFGQEYHAGSGEQGKLMFDAFEALTNRYPEYAEQLTQRTSIAKAEDVKDANTKNADPTYFRGCKAFNIGGVEYLVGTSYEYKAKLSEIKGMFKICGVPLGEFVLDGKPLGGGRGFKYTLWGISHTSNKMSDMMHDVFDLIAEKYPEKIPELATSDAISSVAQKEDVDGKNLPVSKLNYFRASREHNVNGIAYYVGTSYNRSQGIGQIERMLKICEGSADSFVITSSPERISHSGGNTGKKGIGELL